MGERQHDPDKQRVFVRALEGSYSLKDELGRLHGAIGAQPAGVQEGTLWTTNVERTGAGQFEPRTINEGDNGRGRHDARRADDEAGLAPRGDGLFEDDDGRALIGGGE